MPSIRYHVAPRDAPAIVAARKLGLTLDQFSEFLPALVRRGFPLHDQTTGLYDLEAIQVWQNARHPQLFTGPELKSVNSPSIGADPLIAKLKALAK